MKKLILSAAIFAASAQAACPITECNYLDPQYQAAFNQYRTAFEAWSNCNSAPVHEFVRAMDMQAVVYPRFGIAWHAQKAEMEAATHPDTGKVDQGATEEAHRRFEDRILRTAEPEALEFYNLMTLKVKQQAERCGPPPVMPEPPKGQP